MTPSKLVGLVCLAGGAGVHGLTTARRWSRLPMLHRGLSTMSATGDVVTVDWAIRQAGGASLPEAVQVFDQGRCCFVLGSGGYLPCLHAAVEPMAVGDKVTGQVVAPADAFGEPNGQLGPFDLPIDAAPSGIEVGNIVQLSTGQRARVTAVTDEIVQIDCNKAMAGVELELDVELLSRKSSSEAGVAVADFALGCFWGAELAFQREPGVLSTKVGYTQGQTDAPSYQEVCSGTTGHTEAVQVVFDPTECSYERLLELFWDRLSDNRLLLNQVGNDRGTQYRHGIYTHSPEQLAAATASLEALPDASAVKTEISPAATFFDAEDYHQQYLQKGGQSAKKQATETIRCYG